ncbi:nucleotidyltransferase domain-containing protein [Chromohalobacter israelensis]|uniref:nucleotidyltransferase domain-containing protein n=1 Tax=Chromohalobacter israelensis TaxID=141390 RepID=UPI00055170B6|nr:MULTISPECIES: nucleotidyltransferase domain-containing protein [Chromohalobacter]MBZ5876667.1 nucleotidyltransferase domain-containing protein [Chromohalobacter salexigens]MDF9435600.1 nucleotidyltransferase domain-containing protein [Chromohalobacter israelensis]
MRLTQAQQASIKRCVEEIFGTEARVLVFGSRLDDSRRGGDLDLLVQHPHPIERPALTSARLAARISRLLDGRHVDVLLQAPGLKSLPIHHIAESQGAPL